MWSAKAEEAFKEVELSQWETAASRREEDQTPLMKYSSRSGSDQRYRGLGGCKACIILVAIIAILALVIGLAVGLTVKHKHEHEHEHSIKPYIGNLSDYGPVAADFVIEPEFTAKPGVGACGHTPGVFDVKISPSIFAAPSPGSNLSASCGRTLRASGNGLGNTFTVYDKCQNCGPIDLSVSDDAWRGLVNSQMAATVTWYWLTPTPSA